MRSARRIGLLVVLFSSIQLLAASDLIRINESEMKATVVGSSRAELILAGRWRFAATAFLPGFNSSVNFDKEISVGMSVWNDSEAEITGTLSFDLLDSNDVVVSTSGVRGRKPPYRL
jgi:hypothetical protein